MDQTSPVQARKVWQRVRSTGAPEADPLAGLIRAEREAACTYLQLSRAFSGRKSLVLRRMFEQAQAHGSCLLGIYTVQSGRRPELPPARPLTGTPEQILRSCYGRKMRTLTAYEARSCDPEYGPVFAKLRDQEQEHCRLILELIGNLHGN